MQTEHPESFLVSTSFQLLLAPNNASKSYVSEWATLNFLIHDVALLEDWFILQNLNKYTGVCV